MKSIDLAMHGYRKGTKNVISEINIGLKSVTTS